jgi:hypothetical protein
MATGNRKGVYVVISPFIQEDTPVYSVGDQVFIDIRNMKMSRPMKKGDDKWAGSYPVTEVYP